MIIIIILIMIMMMSIKMRGDDGNYFDSDDVWLLLVL